MLSSNYKKPYKPRSTRFPISYSTHTKSNLTSAPLSPTGTSQYLLTLKRDKKNLFMISNTFVKNKTESYVFF